MKKISEYWDHNVETIDTDGKLWKGYVFIYSPAGEDEDDEDEYIVLSVPGIKNKCFSFYPSDIKSIKEVDDEAEDEKINDSAYEDGKADCALMSRPDIEESGECARQNGERTNKGSLFQKWVSLMNDKR